ncbi:P-loop containing nucleoside triphosphate hydrolase protein [Crucibulum laeve]|uniref:P-loop containing nucleoside triphosphate hydrolase protein n=1 Tax=Crucibulum laeve TaxID=68775 RepID=A0A5C3LMT1_9AGAR|nr:P-loop containing nucleoside triphosphate hydrolase protein [Crucibulum laeve]
MANMFPNASGVSVYNSTLNAVAGHQLIINPQPPKHQPAKMVLKPSSSGLFTGQQVHLDKLKHHFSIQNGNGISPRRSFLIYGLGGVGKTQIALKFAEEVSSQYTNIFWVDATNEDTIIASLKGIASAPEAKKDDVDETPEAVLYWIASLSKEWLLIFDNADGEPNMIEEYLPSNSTGDILITSRNPNMRALTTNKNSIELDGMTTEDAIALLLKRSDLEEGITKPIQEAAERIITALFCLPLAVDQAGAFITSGLCSIYDYLDLYSELRKELMDHPSFRGASNYEQTVYGTWELSYKKIECKAVDQSKPREAQAAQTAILTHQIMAFFHHENIMEDIFFRATEQYIGTDLEEMDSRGLPLAIFLLDEQQLPITDGKCNKLIFWSGIQVLLSFSLIKKGFLNGIYGIHPMVHTWCRDRMTKYEREKASFLAMFLLGYSVRHSDDISNYIFNHALAIHIKMNQQYLVDIFKNRAYYDDIYVHFAIVLSENGNWTEAEKLQVEVMEKRQQLLGPAHPDTLTSIANLAATYSNQGNWNEAEKLEVEKTQQLLGPAHPDTLTSMENLAQTYLNQEKWTEAKILLVKVARKREIKLSLDHCLHIFDIELVPS